MRDMRKFFRIAGPLAFIALAIYTVAVLDAQVTGDFSTAATWTRP